MSEFVVGLLRPDDTVRVYHTRDLEKSLRNFRDRGRVVVPVFAVECDDPGLFAETAGLRKLPAVLPVDEAAAKFGQTRTAFDALPLVLAHLKKQAAVGLLVRWPALEPVA